MYKEGIPKLAKFCQFFCYYVKKKLIWFSIFFESNKNILVKLFTIKRGRYNRPFLHTAAIGVLSIGVIASPFLADTFPIFATERSGLEVGPSVLGQSIVVGEDVFKTNVSQKPRDKVIIYNVQKGDTVSTIAEKFSSSDNLISSDTIRWANDLKNDNITVGDELKILPVSGVEHKVAKGDSVYSIGKKYNTDPQKIVDFPFNDFANPETFALVEGQKLIVPDGVMPSAKPYIRQKVYIAQGPASGSSVLTWPVRGGVSQFASWYHMALDITADVATLIVAAQDGVVTGVNIGGWNNGYGTSVWVSDGNGLESHYAHLGLVNVSVGEKVERGVTVIGSIGMTGRTTGPHVHFEIRKNGVLVNPLSYLQ